MFFEFDSVVSIVSIEAVRLVSASRKLPMLRWSGSSSLERLRSRRSPPPWGSMSRNCGG